MSGPVSAVDVPVAPLREPDAAVPPTVEITDSRTAMVGALPVRRALPRRGRRTVGAWCFADHMGPAPVTEEHGIDVGPHPHIGLHTVTWLVAGEILHRDSLGSEQLIRPGQLNLMTAGTGVVHAEEATGSYRGQLHGIQLWVAQPEATRHGPAAFEHHAELPRIELGHATASVIVGDFADAVSPARHDTPLVGAELGLRPGSSTWPLRAEFEYALVVLDGAVDVLGSGASSSASSSTGSSTGSSTSSSAGPVVPGHLAYLGVGRDEISVSAAEPTRLLLLGGTPLTESVFMWWNFVARSRDEVDAAYAHWADQDGYFEPAGSQLARIPAPAPPWRRAR